MTSQPVLPDAAHTALLGAPDGDLVAVVNGERITAPVLEVFARGKGLDVSDPAQRATALEQLEETLLLAQQAIRSGVASKPDVQAEVTLARLLQLSGRMVSTYRSEIKVPEDQVRAYYDQEVARVGGQQFHLQHILFDNEDDALKAAGRAIQPDADFAALMGEYAVKGSLQARDLGWVNRTQIPAEVAESAANLRDGETSPVPIHSSFGWHVLRRVESRSFVPPPFEKVRDGAERQLQQRALADQVRALKSQAKIVEATPAAAAPGKSAEDQGAENKSAAEEAAKPAGG